MLVPHLYNSVSFVQEFKTIFFSQNASVWKMQLICEKIHVSIDVVMTE